MAMLAGQVALITGGGRGIGRALAQAFASAGAAVCVIARSDDQLRETVAMIRASGARAISVAADVTDARALISMRDRVEAELGPIDLLVNNAGSGQAIGPLWESDPDEWWHDVETNLRGPFLCCRTVVPGMVVRRRGRIINLASGIATGPFPYTSAYGSSKAGLLRLTDCLANELRAAEAGVSVFAVSPGGVRTAMMEHAINSPQGRRWLSPFAGNLQLISTDRIAELALFLASGEADVLSGRFISVNDDVRELVRRAQHVERDNLYALKLDKLPL
jgi:NAD(P)-dependent dehydrogenase (short-subunit alcohol dehydrogenase family)